MSDRKKKGTNVSESKADLVSIEMSNDGKKNFNGKDSILSGPCRCSSIISARCVRPYMCRQCGGDHDVHGWPLEDDREAADGGGWCIGSSPRRRHRCRLLQGKQRKLPSRKIFSLPTSAWPLRCEMVAYRCATLPAASPPPTDSCKTLTSPRTPAKTSTATRAEGSRRG